MNASLQLKALIRTPLKTILTFSLLAIVSFALFSRVSEYAIVEREIKNAAKSYVGVGSVEVQASKGVISGTPEYIFADPRFNQDGFSQFQYKPLSKELVESMKSFPFTTSWNSRYMTSGVSKQYLRIDEGPDYYDYTARVIIEGTLKDVNYNAVVSGSTYNELIIEDYHFLAGDPSLAADLKTLMIRAFPNNIASGAGAAFGDGGRIIQVWDDSYIYDMEYIKNLKVGSRYVIVCRMSQLNNSMLLFLGDFLTNRWCDAIQAIEGERADYLSSSKFDTLGELVEITNADRHTFDVVYTEDFSAILRFAESKMAIKKGRELSRADSTNQNSVCVISDEFAYANGLSVGDKISLTLGTELFEQYKGLGAIAVTRERYKKAVNPVELEIVGIYIDTDGENSKNSQLNWNYSVNTIFVPRTLLPLEEAALSDHLFSPSEFSFIVGDAWAISSFVEEIAPKLEELGFKLIFYDGGWLALEEQFKLAEKLSMIAISAILAALIVTSGFIVYLYIGRKKKEYAIMRALGTTRKIAAESLLFPLIILCVLAVLVGCITGLIYTSTSVAKTNTALLAIKGYSVNSSVPVTVIFSCVICQLGLIALFAVYGLCKLGKHSTLSLLQDQQWKIGLRGKTDRTEKINSRDIIFSNASSKAPLAVSTRPFAQTITKEQPKQAFGRAYRHVLLNSIVRHIVRSPLKSFLGIGVSALLLGAAGQFAIMQNSYSNLYNSIDVDAKFVNGLTLISLYQILSTDLVDSPYYEGSGNVELNNNNIKLVLTSDLPRYTREEIAITYAEGFDESCMQRYSKECIVGKSLMDQYNLQLGTEIHLSVNGTMQVLKDSLVTKYRNEHPSEGITDEEILELCNDELMGKYMKEGDYYIVAGTVVSSSGKFNDMIFSPGNLRIDKICGHQCPLDLVEFHIRDNSKAAEFRKYANMIAGREVGNFTSSRLTFIMDTSKIDHLNGTLTLLRLFYPIVIAAAVIIGGILFGLMIIQSAKEAAIFRVLGTTRLQTCAVLVIEQIIICIFGVAIGLFGLFLYNMGSFVNMSNELLLIAGTYISGGSIGSLICSIIVTHRKTLDLLQTKE